SVKELVEYAKARPSEVNYSSSAAAFQLTTELFKQKTGTQFTHIPYKGSGDSIKAVMAGEVTMTIVDPPPAAGPIKGGQLRALAVTAPSRHPNYPDVPTMAEAGGPDMESGIWTAFFVPGGTPPAGGQRVQEKGPRGR